MLGRFLELSVMTADIRASVEFYERLGFTQCATGDIWPHPYGVLSDGHISIGLHQLRFPAPSLTFVRDGIAQRIAQLEAAGVEIAFRRTGDDIFNEVGFVDPTGHMVTVLEARTFSPVNRDPGETTLCGDFREYSLPARDFELARQRWESFGFVAIEDEGEDLPYRRLSLTSDHLNLAFHSPRFFAQPLLVFSGADPGGRRERLAALGIAASPDLPAALDAERYTLIESPAGVAILLAPE
jgi:catechol 2,3-dioxygenase-like lactoylglutathione lyase family enzyme